MDKGSAYIQGNVICKYYVFKAYVLNRFEIKIFTYLNALLNLLVFYLYKQDYFQDLRISISELEYTALIFANNLI